MSKRKHGRGSPLLEEPAVRELLKVMEAHNAPGQTELQAMLRQIAGLEQQLNTAMEELAAMRQELAQARESPVKRALQAVVGKLEKSVAALREHLDGLKHSIVEGCKKALSSFWEHGVSALAHTAKFFHVRPALKAMETELEKAVAQNERALSIIDTASREYHEAGRHLKNVLRAVRGQEPQQEAKGPGALARGLSAPFRQEHRLFSAMKARAGTAIERLEQLEQAARPPIRQTMKECAKLAQAQESKERAAPVIKHDER